MSGFIDETFSTEDVFINTSKPIEINLKDIRLISSNGIREWIKFINKYKAAKFSFVECSKVFIDQVNATNGFCPPNAVVNSFYTPYFNKKTNTEKSVLFQYGKDYTENGIKAPNEFTADQGEVFIIDINENKYFKFIKNRSSLPL